MRGHEAPVSAYRRFPGAEPATGFRELEMAKFHVTLKATLKRGELYWVSDVTAADEDEAMRIAEAGFMQELENPEQWEFTEADVEGM
jgi:transcriptional antiterminator Rof (Rho-off)